LSQFRANRAELRPNDPRTGSMITLSGTETWAVLPTAAVERLTDCRFLAGCVPDAQILTADADRAVWRVQPNVSFVSRPIESTLTITARTSDGVRFEVVNTTTGAGLTAVGGFRFTPIAVEWQAEVVTVRGLLKIVPQAVLRSAAERLIADVWQQVRNRLADAG
jgi:carbon monoxide dehydrogenase subunit G